jgi:hypothetical protein
MQSVRKTLLTLIILAPTFTLGMLFPITHAKVPGMLPRTASFADVSSSQPMNNSNSDIRNLRQLAHVLADAYGNALLHNTPNADLEAADLVLESASIRFSSRLLYEITRGSCQPDRDAASPDRTCVLDDESVGLRSLTDMLSYAAYRLESLVRPATPADGTDAQRAVGLARIQSMQHLYRMVFAFSMVYLDRSQSDLYFEAAREQLGLARKHMENDRILCACSDHEYTVRLLELSELEERLKDMQGDAVRP